MMVISLPFLNRVSDHHQHGHASSQSAGAREAGMPSRTEPAGQRYAIKVGSTGDVVWGASYIIQL